MIVSFIVYSLVVAALVATAAWLLERAFGILGHERRRIWIAAVVVALALPPLLVMSQAPGRPQSGMQVHSAPAAVVEAGKVAASLRESPLLRDARVADLPVDAIVAGLWLLASLSIVGIHAFGAWRLSRRARRWHAASVDSQAISVAPDIGPALYGWWRPRVVFPAWLLTAPESTQRFALAHEREHLAARDPQLLAAATLSIALMPWNAPLLWMLGRLRFAMEVDCDARVIRAGADASDYGLALLFVSERQARSPMGTLALIERASQLERRIHIMVGSPRHRALVAGLCLFLAGGCVLAATQVAPPARLDTTPIKLPPSGGPSLRVGQAVEMLARARYPELLEGRFEGWPVLVVLLNEDFSVAKSARIEKPSAEELVSATDFHAIGLSPEQVPYVGATMLALPGKPGRGFLAAYTEQPAKPGERFVSKLFPDTRTVDRRIFEHSFDLTTRRAIPPGQSPWLLLDRGGKVLRSGVEPMNDGRGFLVVLTTRFDGIKAQEMTVTPLTDSSGKQLKDASGADVNLVSVWLAPGSAPPAD